MLRSSLKILISLAVIWSVLFALDAVAQTQPPDLEPSELLPETTANPETGEEEEYAITSVRVPGKFTGEGRNTTDFSKLRNTEEVEDLTFDDGETAKIVFKEPVDLSSDVAAEIIGNLNEHLQTEYLKATFSNELFRVFASPAEVTLYKSPFVWNVAVARNGVPVDEERVTNTISRKIVDGTEAVSFIVFDAGTYTLIPVMGLEFTDKAVVRAPQQEILGRIADPEARVSLSVNTQEVPHDQIELNPETGEFSATVTLVPGSNLIVAVADSEYGDIPSVSKQLYYEESNFGVQGGGDEFSLNPLVYLAVALVVLLLFFVLVAKLSKRR